ncbi:MAG: thioesterase family protein [Deltaproteobacteria bacterium]|nr:thioesterase family protein [Deltaproteobacteria bacterium]
MQGRSVFGGLQLALCLRAFRALVPTAPLRALAATFVAPAAERLDVRAQVLRRGRSATHAEARLMDQGAPVVLVTGFFAEPRASAVAVTPSQALLPAVDASPLPYVPGVTPKFTQHFQVRLLRGALPFQGVPTTEASYDVSMRDDGPATEAHVVAIADFVPPLALSHLRQPAPGSTVTWLLEFLGAPLQGLGLQGWRADVTLDAARDGYSSQGVLLWGPGGVPVALSRQSMVVFG